MRVPADLNVSTLVLGLLCLIAGGLVAVELVWPHPRGRRPPKGPRPRRARPRAEKARARKKTSASPR